MEIKLKKVPDFMFNFYDKINIIKLEHSFTYKIISVATRIILFAILLAAISYFIKEQLNLTSENNSGFIVILASILGATVGGLISYFINIKSMKQSSIIKSSIINKRVIFEPLLAEFKKIHKDLENKPTLHFCYDSNYRTIGSTSFEVWNRIKNDARLYQLPDFYRKQCLNVEHDIKNYSAAKNDIINKSYEILESLLEEQGCIIKENKDGIKSFIHIDTILENKNPLEEIFQHRVCGIPEIDDIQKATIISSFQIKFNETKALEVFLQAKSVLKNSITKAIDLTELIVIKIASSYERKIF